MGKSEMKRGKREMAARWKGGVGATVLRKRGSWRDPINLSRPMHV